MTRVYCSPYQLCDSAQKAKAVHNEDDGQKKIQAIFTRIRKNYNRTDFTFSFIFDIDLL